MSNVKRKAKRRALDIWINGLLMDFQLGFVSWKVTENSPTVMQDNPCNITKKLSTARLAYRHSTSNQRMSDAKSGGNLPKAFHTPPHPFIFLALALSRGFLSWYLAICVSVIHMHMEGLSPFCTRYKCWVVRRQAKTTNLHFSIRHTNLFSMNQQDFDILKISRSQPGVFLSRCQHQQSPTQHLPLLGENNSNGKKHHTWRFFPTDPKGCSTASILTSHCGHNRERAFDTCGLSWQVQLSMNHICRILNRSHLAFFPEFTLV